MSFSVVDVTDWPLMAEEPVGADVKEWICPPRAAALADGREKWWLYKPAKSGIRKVRGGLELSFRRMDDVVERLVCELARLVGVPAADVELASRSGVEG